MDRKWKTALALIVLCWAAVVLPSLGPFAGRAEARWRYVPIALGDPDDVYWSPGLGGKTDGTSAVAKPGPEAEPPATLPGREVVHREAGVPPSWHWRLLSLIVFRP